MKTVIHILTSFCVFSKWLITRQNTGQYSNQTYSMLKLSNRKNNFPVDGTLVNPDTSLRCIQYSYLVIALFYILQVYICDKFLSNGVHINFSLLNDTDEEVKYWRNRDVRNTETKNLQSSSRFTFTRTICTIYKDIFYKKKSNNYSKDQH